MILNHLLKKKETRFPERGRDIYLPLINIKGGELIFNGPLPNNGFGKNENGVVLKDVKLNSDANFASIDAPSQAVGALFDELSQKYPNLEKEVLYRLAKVAVYVSIDVPLMVASHEMAHAGAAIDSCPQCSPTVVMTGWMSGYTSYNYPAGTKITEKEQLFGSVAGMNQATYNGEEISRRMHTKGADLADAIQYLVNITNSVNYQMKDWIKKSKPGYNDAATYHHILEQINKGWNQENLSMLALGVNLLNADFWASLIGSTNYIATGKEVKIPEVKVGNVNLSLPSFSLMHTYEGPQLNTSIFAHMNSPATLEVKYSTLLTPDNGMAAGIETRLHNLTIPNTNNSLSISPRVGASIHNNQPGFKVGTGIEYRPGGNDNFAITASLDYRKNYMPDLPLPDNNKDGLSGTVGLNFNF